jgi:cytochrome d ubiquinol oxidase subunit II
VLLTILSLIATLYIRPGVLGNFNKWPIGYIVPIVVAGSLIYLFVALRSKNDRGAFLASCGYIVGMLVGAAFALYPNVLPASTDPTYSLTIYNTATGAHGMQVGLVWWVLGMILATVYFVFVYRMFRGKVQVEGGASGHGY